MVTITYSDESAAARASGMGGGVYFWTGLIKPLMNINFMKKVFEKKI